MKKYITIFAMSLLSCLLMGEEKNQLNAMLTESLHSYLNYCADLQSKIGKSSEKHATYICLDGLTADFPLGSLPNATFFSLRTLDGFSKSLRKELQKGVSAYFVAIRLVGKQIIINVVIRHVKLDNESHVSLSISDGGAYIYEYSSEEQKWLLVKIEYTGV